MTAVSEIFGGGGGASDEYRTPVLETLYPGSSWGTITNVTSGSGFLDSVEVLPVYSTVKRVNYAQVRITVDGVVTTTPYITHVFGIMIANIVYETSLKIQVKKASTGQSYDCLFNVRRRY